MPNRPVAIMLPRSRPNGLERSTETWRKPSERDTSRLPNRSLRLATGSISVGYLQCGTVESTCDRLQRLDAKLVSLPT